jgi:hypothetical protein
MAESFYRLFVNRRAYTLQSTRRVWLPFWTNRRTSDRTSCENVAKRGGAMSKMVIEVPDQFVEVGKAMAEHLAYAAANRGSAGWGEGGGLCSGGSGDRRRGVQDGVSSPRRNLEESPGSAKGE